MLNTRIDDLVTAQKQAEDPSVRDSPRREQKLEKIRKVVLRSAWIVRHLGHEMSDLANIKRLDQLPLEYEQETAPPPEDFPDSIPK